MNNNKVTVIGAGLAGSEAAWQIASRGVPVVLYEMRPVVKPRLTTRINSPSSSAATRCGPTV
ncbi:hypothetical protein HMSSN036_94190 [Paenibacillus macerans]|nr:hypothetical protein HMSSN036_94190 [Paenibacillus macerans]